MAPPDLVAAPPPLDRRRWRAWIGLALVLIGLAAVRLPLADVPLERDEGEYAYAGQLLLAGVPPYRAAYNTRFPGTAAAYAALMSVFGQTPAGIHRGTTAVVAANVILAFLLARRWPGCGNGVTAAAAFAVTASSPLGLGMAGHATHFVVLAALGGLVVLSTPGRRGWLRCAVAGTLLGVSMLMKQPGGAFLLVGSGVIFFDGRGATWRTRLVQLLAMAAGVAAPLLLTAGLLAWAGTFGRFWFWTVVYARHYGEQVPVAFAWANLTRALGRVTTFTLPLWLTAAAGLAAGWGPAGRRAALFRLGLAAAGAVAASPGFYYREHYLIVLLPAVALSAGAAVTAAAGRLGRAGTVGHALPAVAFAGACAWYLVAGRSLLFQSSPAEYARTVYKWNPFVEAATVADYVRSHTTADQTIAVLGSEAEIYFLSHRRAATGYIYTYPLVESQPFARAMQVEMAAEITAARPAYVVIVRHPTSWLDRPTSDRWIFGWADRFVAGDQLVGVVPTIGAAAPAYWDAAAGTAEARRVAAGSEPCLLVFRHRR